MDSDEEWEEEDPGESLSDSEVRRQSTRDGHGELGGGVAWGGGRRG